ncbi:hypothetical protein AS589_07995 [Empedobacter brevis]|uniref:P-loop NTPase n=1 Tax=Empedobacter brevis TaxID=247 RepID=UPI00132038DC|nr:hypothetical protein [Empedobacter brevis]QHC84729.1 hypothetical protein AS589_07995 [Empedobacter brevis]
MKVHSYPLTLKQVTENLDNILQKRNGGAINFRGIHFQMLYACYLILQELKKDSETKSIQLEGIEDIDLHTVQTITIDSEYIQLKSSVNKMDAGTFWGLGVLQNFLEVYERNPESRFKLVYNMKIADGNLSALISKRQGQPLSKFWIDKLEKLSQNTNFSDFVDRITFEPQSTNELYAKIQVLLYKEWNVNKGTESQFLNALFYNVLVWSKNRAVISKTDVFCLFQDIRDSFSKAPVNKAIQNNWLLKVSYIDNGKQSDDYYDGKAARPLHISQGLPVRRKNWERQIEEAIQKSDIVVIRSSSGQGKSTLAWQIGYNLKPNHTIYQLNTCRDTDEANTVVEFLESRVFIGESPLVVIDGLDNSVIAWSYIAEKTNDIPVKFLITTRQEDWFRFGADISRISLTPVDISLSIQEAKDIFEQFKKKKKIHADIKEWQPVWEQVMNKGLLIEYTYLLTKGQMIQERLSSQIKYLYNSASSAAKIEILRMVSLADCLNIKLETKRLIAYIKTEIGFQQDRGILLRELEKEYFLNFDGQYVEGLHPVRSNHLKDLLHHNLPIEESLLNLLKIVDENYKHDFFINAPLLLTNSNKAFFYRGLASLLSEGEISDMVFALDGIMHGEPQRYWLSNKELFDEAYNTGGIELFSMATVPFTELNTLDELSRIMGERGRGFQQLAELKMKLPIYSFESTDLVLFANALKDRLAKRTVPVTSYQGLEFLIKWFNELKLSFNLPFIQHKMLVDDLISMEIQEAKEFMLYSQISNPVSFKKFVSKNKAVIISYLKVNTNSLTIEERDGNVYIQYLLFDNEADKANEFSVFRIQVLHAFLPFYKQYCTEAILLPFPSEEIISAVKQNSIKHLTVEAIGNMFDVHLNKIWLSAIQKNYQENSAYEWQKNTLEVRKIAVEWSKSIVKLVDSLLEGNNDKKEKALSSINQLMLKLSDAIAKKKPYPKYEKKYFELNDHLPEEREVNKWFSSLGNTNNQLLNIFIPKDEHARNVALINLKAVYLELGNMQEAFRKIENKTIPYFDSESICQEEKKCFERLYTTIQYYISHIPLENKKAVRIARVAVEEWWSQAKNEKLNKLKSILNVIEEDSNYEFILPHNLEETETLTYATFGIRDFDFSDKDAFFQLSMDLALLSTLDIDFFSIIVVKDDVANGGLRFKKDYFEAFNKLLMGEEHIDQNGLNLLPIHIDPKTIATLPEISLPVPSVISKEKEIQCQILFGLWKLSEYRTRLNKESEIEKKWLQTIELQSKKTIEKLINSVSQQHNDFINFVNKGLEKDVTYIKEDVIEQLFRTVQKVE